MMTSIDSAGRLVIPKALREMVGLVAGPVEITAVGATLVIEPPSAGLVEKDGHLFLPSSGRSMTVDEIRELRLADQR